MPDNTSCRRVSTRVNPRDLTHAGRDVVAEAPIEADHLPLWATSLQLNTNGNRFGRLARTTFSSQPRS